MAVYILPAHYKRCSPAPSSAPPCCLLSQSDRCASSATWPAHLAEEGPPWLPEVWAPELSGHRKQTPNSLCSGAPRTVSPKKARVEFATE
eukprot:2459201-Pyramimonas_sp.AAC.1